MADEESEVSTATGGSAPDLGWHPTGAPPKDPGWYPTSGSLNDQAYWDGQSWSGSRHWTVNGWVEQEKPPARMLQAGSGSPPRLSGNPYAAAPSSTRPKSAPAKLNLGVLLMMVCAIVLMFGSVGSWVSVTGSVSIAAFHLSINGIDPEVSALISVNGYVTFIGGIVLLVLAGLALTNDDLFLAILTTVAAAAILVFAVYDMFRIVQKISQVTTTGSANVSVGWGLIAVLSGAVLALLVSLIRLASR